MLSNVYFPVHLPLLVRWLFVRAVELEPKIWVPQTQLVGKASFRFSMNQIVLEPEPKTSWCWIQSQKN